MAVQVEVVTQGSPKPNLKVIFLATTQECESTTECPCGPEECCDADSCCAGAYAG